MADYFHNKMQKREIRIDPMGMKIEIKPKRIN
jgi:hypothetical protein